MREASLSVSITQELSHDDTHFFADADGIDVGISGSPFIGPCLLESLDGIGCRLVFVPYLQSSAGIHYAVAAVLIFDGLPLSETGQSVSREEHELNTLSSVAIRDTLGYCLLLAVLLLVCLAQTAMLGLQLGAHELPCPLCLLQRLALFGVAFGLISAFRIAHSPARTGYSLLSALLLLIIAARQCLNNITPRPGHDWIGGTLLGLHFPVWSVLLALFLLVLLTTSLLVFPQSQSRREIKPSLVKSVGSLVSGYAVMLCMLNVALVVLQCGCGICHTYGYSLLP